MHQCEKGRDIQRGAEHSRVSAGLVAQPLVSREGPLGDEGVDGVGGRISVHIVYLTSERRGQMLRERGDTQWDGTLSAVHSFPLVSCRLVACAESTCSSVRCSASRLMNLFGTALSRCMIATGTTRSSSSARYANDSSSSCSALDCSILPMRCSSLASSALITRR